MTTEHPVTHAAARRRPDNAGRLPDKPGSTPQSLKDELRDIIERSGPNPDPADIRRVREILTQDPELWRTAGDPVRQCASLTLDNSEFHPVEREGLRAGFFQMIEELDYPAAHPLVRLSIDHLALAWMHLAALEYEFASGNKLNPYQRSHLEKRIANAHRRVRDSCESLAQLQKTLLLSAAASRKHRRRQADPSGKHRHSDTGHSEIT